MDFSKTIMERGFGNYMHLDVALPPMFLAYHINPSDSGRIHSNVSMRWQAGRGKQHDADIIDKFASIQVGYVVGVGTHSIAASYSKEERCEYILYFLF